MTFEHDYDVPGVQFTIVDLEEDGQKYCTYEFSEEYSDLWMLLYNLDHTNFLELNFDLSSYLADYDSWTGNVFYITENVFDQDIEIEVLLEIDVVRGTQNYHHLIVFNEDGTILFQQDDAYVLWAEVYGDMPKGIFLTPYGPKMILDVFDGAQWLYKVYNLGGTSTSANTKSVFLEPLPQAFPNPATNFVRFNLKSEQKVSEIKIFDLAGSLVVVKDVNQLGINFSISTVDLPSGTYNYQIISDKKGVQSGKFVVKK